MFLSSHLYSLKSYDMLTFLLATGTVLVVSCICSLLEAALYSLSVSQIEMIAREHRASGQILKKLHEDIQRPISAILTLNTLANTGGAAIAGAAFVGVFPQTPETYFTIAISFGVLVFSEIIPKTIGAKYWNSLAKFTTIFLSSIIPIFKYTGILWVLQAFTKSIGASKKELFFKREDISTLAEIAEEQGVIKEKDSDFIKNIVKLQNVKLREIMTPSSVIKSADMDSTIEDFYSKNKKLPFSRIPIYSKNKEEINYYVLKDTILEYVIQKNGKKKLSDIKRPIIKIGYESKITVLFDKLLKKREHISLVIDEFGAVRGIVTLEDIIETLLGLEIVDETDSVVDLQVLAKKRRKQYLKDVD